MRRSRFDCKKFAGALSDAAKRSFQAASPACQRASIGTTLRCATPL